MFLPIQQLSTEGKVPLTDSRFLSDPDRSVFFAIQGVRHDGHRFIPDLYGAGLREFVVESQALTEEQRTWLERPDVQAYCVTSSIGALQTLAAAHRNRFSFPVVGITGSNGKTIVKEWLSSVLEPYLDIVKSPRSYNSQIGVALSVWEMSGKNQLGIFEAGISQPGEMTALEKMIHPSVGIFTNIGSSHNEGFQSTVQKIQEKLLLFRRSSVLIYCRDHAEVHRQVETFLRPMNPGITTLAWSWGNWNALERNFELEPGRFVELPFSDEASVENAVHAAHAAHYLIPNGEARLWERFKFLNPVAMRLELKEGREGNYVIDDTYNNDLGGLQMALNFMQQTHTKRVKVLILSDLLQSGLSGSELSRAMEDLIRPQRLEAFIGVGQHLSQYPLRLPGTEAAYFQSTDELLRSGKIDSLHNALILVKGARSFSFEKIVEKLERRIHGTVLEINLDAVTNNLNIYRSRVAPGTRIMVMVKALAYGSGSEVTAWLQYHRVDYLAVAYPDEGVALRQNGITLPIMVMNADPDSFSTVFEYNLEPEIYSFRGLEAYHRAKAACMPDSLTRIHLKMDTGMHRLGFAEEEAEELVQKLLNLSGVEVASIFSHLAAADDAHHDAFTRKQIACFERASHVLVKGLGYMPLRHICNTAGIERFPEAHFDMVRLGIGLYGVDSSSQKGGGLQTVATLKTTISQIKILEAGQTVGYGRNGLLGRPSRIATIAIGYADGYDRRLGGGVGKVLVNGKRCPTVGNVCMDMTMVDVTDTLCQEGDEVVVFGEEPSLGEIAKTMGTIPYELLTGVSHRVKRIFYHA